MIKRIPGAAVLMLALLMAGSSCAPASVPEAPREPTRDQVSVPDSDLAASLQVENLGDSVRFSLRVTNAAPQPVQLTFPTGQSFDFVVLQEGRELWRWSADMMFTQAIRQEALAPEETRTYSASWSPPAATRGRFVVQGFLTAQEHRLEQQTDFRLP
jgi:hypothetical protein